jgi:hypothetical protein
METGLLLLAYAATFRLYQKLDFSTWGHYLAVGFWLGLVILIRIDASFFVLCICVLNILLPAAKSLKRRIIESSGVGAAAAFVSAPWWLYNIYYFGNIMPSSGQATSSSGVSLNHLFLAVAAALSNVVSQVQFQGLSERNAALLHLGLLALTIGIISKCYSSAIHSWTMSAHAQVSALVVPSCALLATVSALLLWYSSQSAATWFYPRYLSPLVLVGCVIIATAIIGMSEKIALAAPVVLVCVAVFYFKAVAYAFVPVPYEGLPHREANLVLVATHVPPNEVVAAGQVGVLGFFRDRVFNLDGKVNNEANVFRGRVSQLIDHHSINWVCDSPDYLGPLGFSGKPPEWNVVEERNGTVLYKRRDKRLAGNASETLLH